MLSNTIFDGQCFAVSVADFPQWCHNVHKGELFFPVGGYDILTGSLVLRNAQIFTDAQIGKDLQTQDILWWPKVNTWNGCSLDVRSWTPLCEHWFQRHLESVLSRKARPLGSATWGKNLWYEKETKKFFGQFKNLGCRFLADNYSKLSTQ